jgi:hypothetical protein
MRWHRVACPERSEGTSAVGIDPQSPSALRVAGGAGPSATPPLLSDVPHRLRRIGVAYGTAAHATPRAGLVQRFPKAARIPQISQNSTPTPLYT